MTDIKAAEAAKDASMMRGDRAVVRHQADLASGPRRRFSNHAGSLIAGS